MARMTGRRLNVPSGWGWARDRDDGEVPWGRGTGKGGTVKATARASVSPSPFPFPPSPSSYHPIHECTDEHHHAHDTVHREERRIEARQVARPHQAVLVRDQRG